MIDSGIGLISGQGSNPQVMLRVSTDGQTWGNQRSCSAGKMGQYAREVAWQICGSSGRIWMPEIVVSDPVPWRLSGAELQGSGFDQLPRAA